MTNANHSPLQIKLTDGSHILFCYIIQILGRELQFYFNQEKAVKANVQTESMREYKQITFCRFILL